MKIHHDALVMVVDGGKMLLFRNHGDASYPHLEVEEAFDLDNPPDHEQASDAPGRTQASAGTARSAMEQTDFHELEEIRFAADAMHLLNSRALANDFESLIIVAPPRTLGTLRKHYHKELKTRLSGEVAKDLSGHPVAEIEEILAHS
jgi:protein required for attachment to host cells